MNEIYLDTASTTKPDKQVLYDIEDILSLHWYNESSPYEKGKESARIIQHSKEQIAEFINCDPEEIYFTPSGSISNNWILDSAIQNDMKIYYTPVEHPSIYNKITQSKFSQSKLTYPFKEMGVDRFGRVLIAALDYHLYEDKRFRITPFVTAMAVNNETGVINDITKISKIVHDNNGWFHTDCTAAISHMVIDVKKQGIDSLTFGSHKLNCPRQLSVLYVKKDFPLKPFIIGGHQQNGLFAGTMPVHLIYALGNQIERIRYAYEDKHIEEIKKGMLFSDVIRDACKDVCEYEYTISYPSINCIPTIHSVIFEGYDNQQLMSLLEENEVLCSTGSACSSGENKPSRVLTAMGLSEEEARSVLRFSFDHNISSDDIKEFGKRLRKCLMMLQK